jgi:hypothetical protein
VIRRTGTSSIEEAMRLEGGGETFGLSGEPGAKAQLDAVTAGLKR